MSTGTPNQLLVLGAGFDEDGQLTTQSRERAFGAYQFYEEHGAESVVFSGGYPLLSPETFNGSSEAKIMAELAVKEGLSPDVIELEEDSFNTFTNFLNSAPILKPQETGVVTHMYHMPRALYIGRGVLTVPVVGVPAAGESAGRRVPGEEIRLMLAKAILLGTHPGELDKIRSRVNRVSRVAGSVAPLVKSAVRKSAQLASY